MVAPLQLMLDSISMKTKPPKNLRKSALRTKVAKCFSTTSTHPSSNHLAAQRDTLTDEASTIQVLEVREILHQALGIVVRRRSFAVFGQGTNFLRISRPTQSLTIPTESSQDRLNVSLASLRCSVVFECASSDRHQHIRSPECDGASRLKRTIVSERPPLNQNS